MSSRSGRESAIGNAEKRMNQARRDERLAHERMKRTGDADDTRAYIEAAGRAQRAERALVKATTPRDTREEINAATATAKVEDGAE